jgi:exosortase
MPRKRKGDSQVKRQERVPAGVHANGVMEKRAPSIRAHWHAIGAIVLSSVFVWAYWPTLYEMVGQWIHQPDYSHGFLVAPLAIFFLWSRRSQLPWNELRPSLYGASVVLVACVLRVLAGAFYLGPLDGWTIPLWIAGVVWMLCGWQVLCWSLPSIVFLWFMIPIPFSAETLLSVPLQSVATKLSTACLVILGQPAFAEGNTIWLGDHQMFIAEACSGLRIFVGIFALAFAFVLFSRWSWWQKGIALVAALPIAVIANVTRVVVTGLLYQLASSDAAMRFSHDLSGLIMIPFAAALFGLFLMYLDRLFPEVQPLTVIEAGRLRGVPSNQ